jgi:ABC-type uncharacterized transport system substrate-binding protein
VQSLRALGYVERQNLILERRAAIVAELVRLKADVIVTSGNPTARAAKAVTTTVPIVAVAIADPGPTGLFKASRDPAATSRGSRPESGRRARPSACSS